MFGWPRAIGKKQVDHVQKFVEETVIFGVDNEVQAASMYESVFAVV